MSEREAMAQGIEEIRFNGESHAEWVKWRDAVKAAAAELRKTCGNCQHFMPITSSKTGEVTKGGCQRNKPTDPDSMAPYTLYFVPADGSGFCHRWEAK